MVKRKRDPTDTEQYFKKKRNSDVRHLTVSLYLVFVIFTNLTFANFQDKSKLALGKATDFHDVEAEVKYFQLIR